MIRIRLAFVGIILLFALASASVAQVWAGPAGIEIEVTSKGKPVVGARVLLRYREAPKGSFAVLTDSRGRAAVVNLAPGAWNIEVSHEDYLSYVAAVTLEAGRKASETTSFLQATGTGRQTIRVKYAKASGPIGTPVDAPAAPPRAADPIPAPAPRADRPVAEPEPEPVELRRPDIPAPTAPTPASPPVAVEPPPATPPVELREPDIPTPSAAPDQAPDLDVTEPELAEPEELAMPDLAPPAAEQPPAAQPVEEPQPEPEAPTPIEEPAEPVMEPAAPTLPDPVEEPAAEEPASPPMVESLDEEAPAREAPQPPATPDMPAPEVAEVPMEAPVETAAPEAAPETMTAPEPPMAAAPPEVVPPTAPEVDTPVEELEAPTPETPDAPAVPIPAEPPAIEESPLPAPAMPEPEPLPEEAEPSPEPEAAPSVPEAAPATPAPPRAPSPSLRTFRDRTCPECKPGEWSAASVEIAGGHGADAVCPPDARELAERAARRVARAPLGSLTGFAGPAIGGVSPTALELMPEASRAAVVEALDWSSDSCRLLAVSIPRGAKFQGFRYEAADDSGQADCVGDRDCPIGDSTFLGNPGIERGQEVTVVYAVFENRSAERERRARLTVYFVPGSGWKP